MLRRLQLKKVVATVLILLAVVFFLPLESARAESTIQCAPGEYDMLDWMTLDADLRGAKHLEGKHYLATAVWPDKFWWIKHPNGGIWDIQLYDSNNIYWWSTELPIPGVDWSDPRNAKRFKKAYKDKNFVAAKRCQKSFTSIGVTDTKYDMYEDCQFKSRQDLRTAYFALAGPYKESLGGDLPANMDVLHFTYLWDCDSDYRNCKTRELYTLSQRYGMVRWQEYKLQPDGSYKLNQPESRFNLIRNGTTQPNFPCF